MYRPRPGVNYLWKRHYPALGVRIPEIVLPGMMAALSKYQTAASIELSFGRETSLKEVVDAPAGQYPITLGHTGTSIPDYLTAAEDAAEESGVAIQLEGDHLIVIGRSLESAVKRIEGVFEKHTVDPEKLNASYKYNFAAISQALRAADVRCFTTDTSDLIRLDADQMSKPELYDEFKRHLSVRAQRRIFNRYLNKKFKLAAADGAAFELEFSREKIILLFVKYFQSIKGNARIYDYLCRRVKTRAFGFEISLDETEFATAPEDAFFYLMEWTRSDRHFDFFAPNIGFRKRADFTGSLKELEQRVKIQSAIARYFDESLLSFHSGSGATPYSGKGKGVYEALLAAAGSKLKYKISGVYFELLMELLHKGEGGDAGKALYSEIFDAVLAYCKDQVETKGELSSALLKKQLADYKSALTAKKCKPRDPRADFFRFNSWLALAFRDEKGARFFRQRLVAIYKKDKKLKETVDREVFGLTERLITGLHFEGNY
jgi:tagaturonate epimerase